MIRPKRFRCAAPRAALLVATLALAIACLASPTGMGTLLVTPPAASVGVGDAVRLTAMPQDDGSAPARAPAVTWTSSDTSVATVDATGLVTGVAPGSAIITATTGDQSGSAQIIVSAHPPGTVEDLSVVATTDSSGTLAFTEVSDGMGRPASYDVRGAPGTTLIWGTNATSVSQGTCATPLVGHATGAKRTCTVQGLAAGTTYSFELVAFRGTLNGIAVFGELSNIATGVTAASTAPVASVSIAPHNGWVLVGGTLQLVAILKDAKGNLLTGRTVTWTSSAPAVATVGGSGLVTGVTEGMTTITAASEGKSDTTQLSVVPAPPPVTYYRTNFNDGTTGPLDVYAYGGGSCAKSTDYRDPGSAYSIQCTIPPSAGGAAALQAWFGRGSLTGTPKDPSLDEDLFEEVRFVLAPGAAAAIGGTTCTSANPGAQFKVHKSVYGQAGSAWNGWVMSEVGPCSDGNVGLFSEPEMWNINGSRYVWPGTFPSLLEGSVYDVVYRYHRYTAQNCGAIAIWVNGAKVMDSPCWSYMGTTNGSAQGLLFWDGATYLQRGLAPFVVYNLFAQATNYPIGGATSSP
ncbi:MAG TPA: Ig-like domain-containing protein [Gemmatimonadales bacterium]|nr:Ig-like domain-containing protein [Gemmatimonadales bacterium]